MVLAGILARVTQKSFLRFFPDIYIYQNDHKKSVELRWVEGQKNVSPGFWSNFDIVVRCFEVIIFSKMDSFMVHFGPESIWPNPFLVPPKKVPIWIPKCGICKVF